MTARVWPEGAVRIPPPAPRRPCDAYRTPAYGTGWTDHEADVLDLLADAGGDLQAHRTVHLEDR